MEPRSHRKRFVMAFVRPFRTAIGPSKKGIPRDSKPPDGRLSQPAFDRLSRGVDVPIGGISRPVPEEGKIHFDTPTWRLVNASTPIIPVSERNMPPLPRYRSQENVVVSSFRTKVLPHGNAKHVFKPSANFHSKDDREPRNGRLVTEHLRINLDHPYQRRRASVVTIHMNHASNHVDSIPTSWKEQHENVPIDHRQPFSVDNSSGSLTPASVDDARHGFEYSSKRAPDGPTCDLWRHGRLKAKYHSSVDLTLPSHRETDAAESQRRSWRLETGEFESSQDDRNLFEIFVIKIKSISPISSPNIDDNDHHTHASTPPIKSDSKFENMKTSTASATLVYKDFDDMIARMLDSKELMSQSDKRDRSASPLPEARQVYFEGQLSERPSPSLLVHSDETRKKACDHLTRIILKHRIDRFNRKYPQHQLNLGVNSEVFEGCLHVFASLLRPVELKGSDDGGLVHLPRDTVEVHRITSETTTKDFIMKFLQEFNINENPRKFALYHKTKKKSRDCMRRLDPDELPLRMYLEWAEVDKDWPLRHSFVLQENDTGEVEWDLFSLPELRSFLRMLNKEERKFIAEIKLLYATLQNLMKARIEELENEEGEGHSHDGE